MKRTKDIAFIILIVFGLLLLIEGTMQLLCIGLMSNFKPSKQKELTISSIYRY